MPERRLMGPVYVCQLEERKQMEVRKLLERADSPRLWR